MAEPVYDPDDFGGPVASSSAAVNQPDLGSSHPDVYYDQVTAKWCYEDAQTGDSYEYDDGLAKWVQVVDEDEFKRQQDAYAVQGVDEAIPAGPVRRIEERKKRKEQGQATNGKTSSRQQGQKKERQSTAIFISNLPLDTAVPEIAAVFSRYGIISENDEGQPRIKLYCDTIGGNEVFKGEALLTYFKAESCQLAIQLLDGTCLRAAEGQTKPEMSVEMATWSKPTAAAAVTGKSNGDTSSSSQAGDPNRKRPAAESTGGEAASSKAANSGAEPSNETSGAKRQRTDQDRRKAAKRFARMNERLAGWNSESDSEEDSNFGPSGGSTSTISHLAGSQKPSISLALAQSRTLILRKIFTLEELKEDPSLLLDLASDMRDECSNYGTVTNVILWDQEPSGIVSVKFQRPEEAREALKVMQGRFFAGRKIEAALSEGKPRFRRSGKEEAAGFGDEDEDEVDETGQAGHDARDGTDAKQRQSEVSIEQTAKSAAAAAAAAVSHESEDPEDGARDTFGDWLEGGGDADDDDRDGDGR